MTTKPTPTDFEPVTMPSVFDYLVDLTERETMDDYDQRTIRWAMVAIVTATVLFAVWFARLTGMLVLP